MCDVAVGYQRPRRRHAAVVEHGLAHELDLDLALEALDRAHQHVVGVVVGRRPGVRRDRVLVLARADGQRLAHLAPSRSGVFHVVRITLVPGSYIARRGHVDAVGAKPELPASRSSRLPNELGESNAGAHSQSTEPSGAISAPVWQSERNA